MDLFSLTLQTLLFHQELLVAHDLHSLLGGLLHQLHPLKQQFYTGALTECIINSIQEIPVGLQLQLVLVVQHFPRRKITLKSVYTSKKNPMNYKKEGI